MTLAPFYRTLLDRSLDLIMVLDEQRRVSFSNQATDVLLGYPPAALVDEHIVDLVHPEDRLHVAAMLVGAKPEQRAFRVRHASGGWRTMTPTISYANDPSGSPVTVLVMRETESEARLNDGSVCDPRLDTLRRMTAGVVHDLSNLFHAMTLQLEVVEEQHLDSRRDATEPLWIALDTAAALAKQLLAFVPGAQSPDTVGRVDADVLIEKARGLLQVVAGRSTHVFYSLGGGEVPVGIGPVALMQVLVNLVTNARDAMPAGGTLTISTREVEDGCSGDVSFPRGAILLEVKDDGMGMPQFVKDRIFEPYFTTKGAARGMGLGLTTVREIVQRAGGCIEIESQPALGTTIRVFLPCTVHTTITEPVSVA